MRKYRFPSGFLVYASALYLFTPDQPLFHLSHSPVFYHSLAPFMSLSIFLSPPLTLSLSIPTVAKAIVFCGGSWLGLICQAADLPSLVLTPFACTLFYFSVIRYTKNTEEPNCHTCISQTIMQYKWKWHISVRSSSLIMFMSVHLKWCVFFHVSNSLAMI